jgi:hypothetical protein
MPNTPTTMSHQAFMKFGLLGLGPYNPGPRASPQKRLCHPWERGHLGRFPGGRDARAPRQRFLHNRS